MKVLAWLTVLVILGYVGYAGAIGAWRYFVLSNLVHDALRAELPSLTERAISGTTRRMSPDDRVARVQRVVLRAAVDADVPLTPEELTVSERDNVLTVRIRHIYPAFEYHTQKLLVPITVERSLMVP